MSRKIKRLSDPGTIQQATFADRAGVHKQANAGIDLKPIGDLGTSAVRIGEAQPILVWNSTPGTIFVVFGSASVGAPAGPAASFPIISGEKYMLNSGEHAWIRASAVGLFAYTADNLV